MTKPFDGIVDDPKSLPVIITEGTVFGVTGLLLGTFIDKRFVALSKKYPNLKIPLVVLQLIILYILVAGMYIFTNSEFSKHFQVSLGGIAFPAFYFGVQSNIFNTAQELVP
jgi:membrane associated rhomboid family serine protease